MSRLTPTAAAPMPISQPSASRRSRRLTPGRNAASRSTRAARNGTSRSPAAPEDLPVEQAGGEHLADAAGVVEPAEALEQAAGAVGLVDLGEDLAHDVVAERRVDRRARVDEAVERVVLVAVDDVDLLGPARRCCTRGRAAMATSVAPRRSTMASITSTVPGDAAVVVAREHDEVAALVGVDPLLEGGAEVGVGVEDRARCAGRPPASISKPSPAMTTAPPPVQAPTSSIEGPGAGRGGVGHGGAEVEVGDDDDLVAPGDLDLDEVGHEVVGRRWCSDPGRRPRPRGWPGWSAAGPPRAAGSGRG